MAKKKRPTKKKGLGSLLLKIAIGIIIILAIGAAFGKKDNDRSTTEPAQTEVTQEEAAKSETVQMEVTPAETPQPKTSQPENTSPETEMAVLFESDEVVNEFIVRYNGISSSPFIDLEKGNIRTKCFAHTYARYVEILNGADDNFHVTVNADYEHQDVADLRDAFKDVVMTLDPSITAEQAYEEFDKKNYRSDDTSIGNVTYKIYNTIDPSISMGRIDFSIPTELMLSR